ncbi:MAG: 30S ribosomal protein S4 [Patescibacteria group bacterium]
MARTLEPACRQCRREGIKLFLKGEKCQGTKCTLIKRNYIPGQHGLTRRRGKMSDYNLQLREKQKVKRIYGILEKQFRNYFERADRKEGVTGEILLQILETRLDNVVYKLGFASSRKQARQFVSHDHFCVNGHKVNIPSYQVKPKDVVSVIKESASNKKLAETIEEQLKKTNVPGWLKLDIKKFSGELVSIPTREELDPEINEQLIVELYSK